MHPPTTHDKSPAERTLTVASRWGLANRLRLLLSGLALSEATGRRFTMLWPRSYDCGAAFDELFVNDLNVTQARIPAQAPVYGLWPDGPPWRDFLDAPEPHLLIVTPSWLIMPETYPRHQALMARCAELLPLLDPVPSIAARVQQFKAESFRPAMIGVHLRRGDYTVSGHSHNLDAVLAQVDEMLRRCPQAGIFLCTDDGAVNQGTGRPTRSEGVRQRFERTYGARVAFTQPRSLDRRQPEAVQDALLDLLLLRETQYFVGTSGSSFSAMATFGRSVPAVLCGMPPAERRRRTAVAVVTGVYPVLKLVGFVQFRRNLPFPKLKSYYSYRLDNARRGCRAWLRRLRNQAAAVLKTRAPQLFSYLSAAKRKVMPR